MSRGEFNRDGFIVSHGLKFNFDYGDTVTVLDNPTNKLVKILVNEGEAEGKVFTVDKQLITVY